MTDHDFIIELFCRVDHQMREIAKHPLSKLYQSEVVTLGLIFALKGVGCRAFFRWKERNLKPLFPGLPEHTRFFRLLKNQHHWLSCFWASPSLLGLVDSFGIELIHPRREGRSDKQIGRKGLSNRRWIVSF